jgi:hypothetical protein
MRITQTGEKVLNVHINEYFGLDLLKEDFKNMPSSMKKKWC